MQKYVVNNNVFSALLTLLLGVHGRGGDGGDRQEDDGVGADPHGAGAVALLARDPAGALAFIPGAELYHTTLYNLALRST